MFFRYLFGGVLLPSMTEQNAIFKKLYSYTSVCALKKKKSKRGY